MTMSNNSRVGYLARLQGEPKRVRLMHPIMWLWYERETVRVDTRSWQICQSRIDPDAAEKARLAVVADCVDRARMAVERGEGIPPARELPDTYQRAQAAMRARMQMRKKV